MSSCCLSTSSLRFLRHLLPTGAFGVPCGSLTQEKPETPLGFPRSPRVRCHRGGCLLYCGEMGVLHVGFVAPTFQTSQSSPFQPVTVTGRHAASSDVHLRSPLRCFPSPVASFGLKLPWTLPLAFHPTVTSDAERDWEQALDTRLKAFASLSSCDLVSHYKSHLHTDRNRVACIRRRKDLRSVTASAIDRLVEFLAGCAEARVFLPPFSSGYPILL